MAFSFFTESEDKSLVLLVDVGSGSVGGALVRISVGKSPHILATVRRDIEFQNALSSARFLLTMNNALEQTLKDLQGLAKGHGAPSQIFCTLSSPWFILKTRHLRIVRGEAFEVSERVVKEFLDEEILKLKEEHIVKIIELMPEDILDLNKIFVDIALNEDETSKILEVVKKYK